MHIESGDDVLEYQGVIPGPTFDASTLEKEEDRVRHIEALNSQTGPVFLVYRANPLINEYTAEKTAETPEIDFTADDGVRHSAWTIGEAASIRLIESEFARTAFLYIADGHHRYETALNYREEIRELRRHINDDDAVNFVLMALIDVDDPGLLVLPTHRLLFGLSSEALASLNSQQLAQYFTVQQLDTTMTSDAMLAVLASSVEKHPSLVVVTRDQNWLLLLNELGRRRMMESGHSTAWNELDVAVAHTLVLEALLGIRAEDVTSGTYIRYTRDAEQALEAVRSGDAQATLLLNATRVRQICEVAQAEDRMPQKSTYFYPKLMSGLVMNPLW